MSCIPEKRYACRNTNRKSSHVWSVKYSAIVIDREGHFSYQKPFEIPMMWKILHISCSTFTDELRGQ